MSSLFDQAPANNGGSEGEARKQLAFTLFEANRELYLRAARRALLIVLMERGTGTINDVRRVLPVPSGINPKTLGAVPGALARARIIRAVGFEKTDRAIAHARHVSRWELVDPSKAIAWLAAHPLPEVGAA